MSLHETPLLRRYWEQAGGILIEEFLAVPKRSGQGRRCIDGIIIRSHERRIAAQHAIPLRGEHVTVIQVKRGRLGMSLLGQAFFSVELIRPFAPASVQSIALCEYDDAVLRPLFERHPNCRVVTLNDLEAGAKDDSRGI